MITLVDKHVPKLSFFFFVHVGVNGSFFLVFQSILLKSDRTLGIRCAVNKKQVLFIVNKGNKVSNSFVTQILFSPTKELRIEDILYFVWVEK